MLWIVQLMDISHSQYSFHVIMEIIKFNVAETFSGPKD